MTTQLEKPFKSGAVFGSATERKLFPVHTGPTRMGIEHALRGSPDRGPGCYEDDLLSIFPRNLKLRPCSLKGSGFGARLSDRVSIPTSKMINPGPAEYQTIHDPVIKTSYLPFGSAVDRFKPDSGEKDILGPGSHDHNVPHHRHVNFDESFGSVRQLKNPITIKCTMGIPEECKKCHQVSSGDYYGNKNYSLCRSCYDLLKKSGDKGMVPPSLIGMKKVRDCRSLHKHEFPGKPSKTIIMTEKELKKIRYREAYMKLYYT